MISHRLQAYLYLIVVAVIWGAAGPVIKFTLGGINPVAFLAYRFTISSLFSIAYFLVKGLKIPKPQTMIPQIVIYGFLAITLALGCLFIGLDESTVLDSIIISTVGPLLVALGGAIFFHDRITFQEKIGIAIVFLGACINSLSPLFKNNSSLHLTGNLFLFLFLIFDSASCLYAKGAVRNKISPIILTNLGFIIGALTLIPYAIYTQGSESLLNSIISLPFKYHLGVWYMALLSGTLAYFLFVLGQKSIEVSEAILFNYLQPLFSVPLAVFWLGEKVTSTFLIGAALVIVGIIIAEYKIKKR